MASEAQRIMNVSLTKIVSSRSRRGGVSLHRNLLVASVLFKARDVYAAEMAGLVVIRNGCVYEPSALINNCDDDLSKAETQELSNENLAADETPEIAANDENFSTDESLIRDEQIMETVNAIVCPSSVPDSTQEQSVKLDSAGDTSSHNKSDSELESCKENIEPSNSNQITTDIVGKVVKPKRSRKQASTTKQSLKRKYTEVEQAVLSITESEVPKKLSRVEENDGDCGGKMDLTCSELSSSFPEWHSDRLSANHREENHVNNSHVNNNTSTVNTATPSQDYKSCMDISEDAYSSSCASDDDQSTYSELTTYHQSSFHSFSSDYCTSSSSSDAITFSLSHPMLVSV